MEHHSGQYILPNQVINQDMSYKYKAANLLAKAANLLANGIHRQEMSFVDSHSIMHLRDTCRPKTMVHTHTI